MLLQRTRLIGMVCCICAGPLLLATRASAQRKSATETTRKATGREVSPEEFRKGIEDKLGKSKGRAMARTRNPNAGEKGINPSIIAVLQQQKISAASAHVAAIGAENAQSAGNQSGSAPQAARPPLALQPQSGSTNAKTTPATANTQVAIAGQPQPSLGPTQTLNANGNNTRPAEIKPVVGTQQADPRLLAPKPLTMCFGPGIRAVNGQPKGAIFTPTQGYNSYTITGCLFGNQTGHAFLIGKFNAQQVNLQVQYWSDNEIDARVDPRVSGELDQDNISLVIAPAGAPQMKAAGFKFMPARSDPAVFLPSIPSSWVTLQTVSAQTNKFSSPSVIPEYSSPANGASVPQEANGDSAYVSRYFNHKFKTGSDYFYFDKLAPGWTTDSMELLTYDEDSCPWVVTYKETFGVAYATWLHDNIRVSWTDTSCSGFMPSPIGIPLATYSDRTGSYYALNVWVRGPRCTDPYTDKPQQNCMQNMQKCGNEACGD